MSKMSTVVKSEHDEFSYVCPKCYDVQNVMIETGKVKMIFDSKIKNSVAVEVNTEETMWANAVKVYHKCDVNNANSVVMMPIPRLYARSISNFGKAGYKLRKVNDDFAYGYPTIVFDVNKHDDNADIYYQMLTDEIIVFKEHNDNPSKDPNFACWFDSMDGYLTIRANVVYADVSRIHIFDALEDISASLKSKLTGEEAFIASILS